MPFFPATMEERENLGIVRDMMIGSSEMEIREESKKLGLKTNVLYFTTVDQDFPALIRRVTFKNTDPSTPLELEVLDGLAKLIPAGLGNWALDSMGRTVEAWMNVFNVGKAASEGDIITQPFYHISQDIGDTSTVKVIKDGNFALSFLEGVDAPTGDDGSYELLPFVVDPSIVFGTDTTLFEPTEFWKSTESIGDFVKNQQCTTGRTPTAFTGTKINIPAGGSITITSVYGHTKNLEYFTDKATDVIRKPGFIDEMRQKSLDLVKSITDKVGTRSGLPLFDAYVRQDFLDNVLRGGIPISLGSADKPKVFHVFSRIHGDIERDYNNFQIDTTYFSQGPGNFRDVCQNRRLDLFHSPSIGNFNVRMFLSFIQSDGYNPLTVASTNFVIREDKISRVLKDLAVVQKLGTEVTFVKSLLQQAFRPGQFFADVAAANIKFDIDEEDVLSIITNAAEQEFAGNVILYFFMHTLMYLLICSQLLLLKMVIGQTIGRILWTYYMIFYQYILIKKRRYFGFQSQYHSI